MRADDSGAIFAERAGGLSRPGAWNEAADAAFALVALQPLPVRTGPHDRGVVDVIADRVLSRLRQLGDHARQELELVDPLDVIPDIIRTLITPTILGMAAACPADHIARLAVPLHLCRLTGGRARTRASRSRPVAVAGLHHDLVVNGEPARVTPSIEKTGAARRLLFSQP